MQHFVICQELLIAADKWICSLNLPIDLKRTLSLHLLLNKQRLTMDLLLLETLILSEGIVKSHEYCVETVVSKKH
jgi:hypothetical protein